MSSPYIGLRTILVIMQLITILLYAPLMTQLIRKQKWEMFTLALGIFVYLYRTAFLEVLAVHWYNAERGSEHAIDLYNWIVMLQHPYWAIGAIGLMLIGSFLMVSRYHILFPED